MMLVGDLEVDDMLDWAADTERLADGRAFR